MTTRAISILERPSYGMVEAAELLGLRADRTRAWLDGYVRAGVSYPLSSGLNRRAMTP